MNKAKINTSYIKTKLGTDNLARATNLLNQVYPGKKVITGEDVNAVIGALMDQVKPGDIKTLQNVTLVQPLKVKIEKSKMISDAELEKQAEWNKQIEKAQQ